MRLIQQHQLLALKLFDPLFIGTDDRWAGSIDNPVEQLPDLLVNALRLLIQDALRPLGFGETSFPKIGEHRARQRQKLTRWQDCSQDCMRAILDFGTRDGTAMRGAIRRITEVVGIMLVAPLRPARGHRIAAIIAEDKTAQRKILADISPRWRDRRALQPCLDPLMRGQINQWLVMTFAQGNAPIRGFDISGIGRAFQKLAHLGLAHFAVRGAFREVWFRFEETLHLGLRREPPAGITFEHFLDD